MVTYILKWENLLEHNVIPAYAVFPQKMNINLEKLNGFKSNSFVEFLYKMSIKWNDIYIK